MTEHVNLQRRRFLRTSALTMAAAAGLGMIGSSGGFSATPVLADTPATVLGASQSVTASASDTAFGPIKQVVAGELNIGYAEVGPNNGPVAILLHGWPYDIHSFVDVAPLLATNGYRVIVPYLRGYGTTTFLSSDTFRNAQPSVVALDIVALMDALQIDKAIFGAFDWGARTANIIAALWPDRVKAMVSVSGYLIGSQAAGKLPLPPAGEYQ